MAAAKAPSKCEFYPILIAAREAGAGFAFLMVDDENGDEGVNQRPVVIVNFG